MGKMKHTSMFRHRKKTVAEENKPIERKPSICDPFLYQPKRTILQMIRDWSFNLNFTDQYGNSPMHLIFFNKKLNSQDVADIINEFILQKNIKPNITNDNMETPLHLAASNGMKQAINTLISRGAKVDMVDSTCNTPAHFFVINERKKYHFDYTLKDEDKLHLAKESASCVKWLISQGFNFDLPDFFGQTALDYAIDHMLHPILPALLEHTQDHGIVQKCNVKNLLITSLESCRLDNPIWKFSIATVMVLLEKGVSIDYVGVKGKSVFTLILEKIKGMDVLKEFMEKYGQILFHRVIDSSLCYRLNNVEYTRLINSLIEDGCDVDAEDKFGITPIQVAVREKNIHAAEILMENDVDLDVINDDGHNLVHLLADKNKYGIPNDHSTKLIFDLLIRKGCNVNHEDHKGRTPLHLAASNGNTVVVKKLIKSGVDVNYCVEKQGNMRPLDYAIKQDHFAEMAKLLLENGAEVNYRDTYSGDTLLHKLVIAQRTDADIRLLLQNGAYVDAWNSSKQTALTLAIKYRSVDIVKELLSYGADINDPSVILALTPILRLANSINDSLIVIIITHLMKLQCIGFVCSDAYKAILKEKSQLCSKIREFDMMEEINLLKRTAIDSNLSLYDLLHLSPKCRAIHMLKNSKLKKKIIDSPKLGERFPEYSVFILAAYREAKARESILKRVNEAWLHGNSIVPDNCIEKIFSYLENTDLVHMIEEF